MDTHDSIIIEKALLSTNDNHSRASEIRDKQYSYINDDSNGIYTDTGTSIFECNRFNNDRWQSFPEGRIEIPMTLTVTGTHNFATTPVPDLVQVKNSFASVLNKLMIESNGIITSQIEISKYVHFYKLVNNELNHYNLTKDLDQFYKSSKEWNFNATAGENGLGFCCNSKFEHLSAQNNEVSDATKTGFIPFDENKLKTQGLRYIKNENGKMTWVFLAVIFLRDLPFFSDCENLLMLRNQFRITLGYNTLNFTATKDASDNWTFSESSVTGKATSMPLLINAASASALTADKTYTFDLSIGGVSSHRKQCRLYIQQYDVAPEIYQQLSNSALKKVQYRDYIVKVLPECAGANYSEVIHTGLANMSKLIILVQPTKAGNANINYDWSPFTDCQTVPHQISKLNLRISGVPLYNIPVEYSHQFFLNQIAGFSNYGLQEKTSASGLIDLQDFQSTMGYIVFDLRNIEGGSENVKKSLEIVADIDAPSTIRLVCLIEYTRNVTIDCMTGDVVNA